MSFLFKGLRIKPAINDRKCCELCSSNHVKNTKKRFYGAISVCFWTGVFKSLNPSVKIAGKNSLSGMSKYT